MSQRLYTLGSNGSGQLGLSHTEDVSAPTLTELPSELKDDRITQIACGGNHTILLSASGAVYAAGASAGVCDGLDSSRSRDAARFTRLAINDKIKLIAATWDASILVTAHDRVFTFGIGERGELGQGANVTREDMARQVSLHIPSGERIATLAACMAHAAVVLTNGEVYVWGQGKQGQCGNVDGIVWEPRRLETSSDNITSAICGKDFTALLAGPYLAPDPISGLQKRDRFMLKDALLQRQSAITKAVAMWGSILAIDGSASLVAWGRDDHGQLGPPDMHDLVDIAAGSEHAVALISDGRVLTWGWGEHGNCGIPVDEQNDVKGRVNALQIPGKVFLIGAGCATTFVVTDVD